MAVRLRITYVGFNFIYIYMDIKKYSIKYQFKNPNADNECNHACAKYSLI